MKKWKFKLGMIVALSAIGGTTVYAAPSFDSVVIKQNNGYVYDYSSWIAGAHAYGKITVSSQGRTYTNLYENCDGRPQEVYGTEQPSTTPGFGTVDEARVWMKGGCEYQIRYVSIEGTAGTAYISNTYQ